MTNHDQGAQEALERVKASIEGYWNDAADRSPGDCQAYREAWNRKQSALKNLRGKFGNPQQDNADDQGRTPLEVDILRWTWPEYFDKVKSDKYMAERLQVLQSTKRLFAEHGHFSEIDLSGRKKIAGMVGPTKEDPVNYGWFGSMATAVKFWGPIKNNDENLSLALDLIPANGGVSREDYLKYVGRFQKAFPNGGDGIATATRLLAMKRRDLFVCLDSQNEKELCKHFRIRVRKKGYEQYWDSIIERIKEARWWNTPAPPPGVERDVWEARAAFLDSMCYEWRDTPGS